MCIYNAYQSYMILFIVILKQESAMKLLPEFFGFLKICIFQLLKLRCEYTSKSNLRVKKCLLSLSTVFSYHLQTNDRTNSDIVSSHKHLSGFRVELSHHSGGKKKTNTRVPNQNVHCHGYSKKRHERKDTRTCVL